MSAKYLALLRGVNVGGKNRLTMKDLAELARGLGVENAQTFIQSGNVVFSAPRELAEVFPDRLASGITQRFGITSTVVLRSGIEMKKIVAENPFLAAGQDDEQLHVAFLKDRPSAEQVASLDPDRSPPDRFIVVGSEIYLYTPNGQANTKLTNAYFDAKLKTVSTGRNWRTVMSLYEMVRS